MSPEEEPMVGPESYSRDQVTWANSTPNGWKVTVGFLSKLLTSPRLYLSLVTLAPAQGARQEEGTDIQTKKMKAARTLEVPAEMHTAGHS